MKFAQVYFDVNMSRGHVGLKALLTKPLKKGEAAVFINRVCDTVKILVGSEFVAHYKHPKGRIEMRTIKYLPQYLEGGEVQYTKALGRAIEDFWAERYPKSE